jgi:hypothetical protein
MPDMMFLQKLNIKGHNKELMLYPMFKYSIKTEMKRKYYERRLKGFF